MIGQVVGSYQIVELLGVGGMGEVYRAKHRHLERQAAIKVLLADLSRNREVADRLFAEARATSLIRHPGIVEVLDCNVLEDGRVYLVMELLSGETLSSRMTGGYGLEDDVPAVLDIIDQVACAIGAAHERGIVHRDLKPENIFLLSDPPDDLRAGPRVKVLDFGIAKVLMPEEVALDSGRCPTRADRLLGTPAYMSPEQCRDPGFVDHRTDIYALGCILFEMLAGRTPFVGTSYGQLVGAQLWRPPPALRDLRPHVDPRLDALVSRLLAKDPGERPQTMEDVRAELDPLRVLEQTEGPRSMTKLGVAATVRVLRALPALRGLRLPRLSRLLRLAPSVPRLRERTSRAWRTALGAAFLGAVALASVGLKTGSVEVAGASELVPAKAAPAEASLAPSLNRTHGTTALTSVAVPSPEESPGDEKGGVDEQEPTIDTTLRLPEIVLFASAKPESPARPDDQPSHDSRPSVLDEPALATANGPDGGPVRVTDRRPVNRRAPRESQPLVLTDEQRKL